MSTKKTIAELRAESQGTAKRAERRKQICLEPQLLAEIQRLTEERQAAFLEALPAVAERARRAQEATRKVS